MLLKPSTCLKCPLSCAPYGSMMGYVPASGTGENGVLVIAEAAGENEADEGVPLIGKAGYQLWQQLARVGIDREGFKVHNVLSCRPPENKLVKMPYEEASISHCSPNLDATIEGMHETCRQNGKNLVIVTLGLTAFKRVMGITSKDEILRYDYGCYPHWSNRYSAYVLAAPHPSYIMRGNTKEWPVVQFTFQRALEIASNGLILDVPSYMLDPNPATFQQWVRDYLAAVEKDPSLVLSYDIETPHKQGKNEEGLAKEDSDDYIILRCSFCYKPNEAVSVPWTAEYMAAIEQLFAASGDKCSWNGWGYDDARIMAQMPINGDRHDGMLMWHVLNSALDKGLGFVTPFYVHTTGMWKHLSNSQPAFYNAKDADMALRNFLGIQKDLVKGNLWPVYERHVVTVHRVFNYMSEKGVLLDQQLRKESEDKLQDILDVTELKMEAAVPKEARKFKVYKKTPKDTIGMEQVTRDMPVKRCSICHMINPKKAHFKAVSAKKAKLGMDSVCEDAEVVTKIEQVQLWAKPLEFKVSKVGLSNYQAAVKHHAIISRKEKKVTFDEKALLQLIKKHPKDKLYPLILDHREVQKLLSTYVGVTQPDGRIKGGMPIGRDGRVHCTFTSNPSTLRSACQNPNLQNLPRARGKDDLETIIRNLIVASPGNILVAVDFSGIEAVLCGYFANAPSYIRLAKIDVHSFYTAYALNQLDGRVASADLPLLSWSDDKLKQRLFEIKTEFKSERNNLYKHLIHSLNFGQSPKGAQEKIFSETATMFPLDKINTVMGIYKELFPEIPKWQWRLLYQVEKDGKLRNPFGYVHTFTKPFEYEKIGGVTQRSQGTDANRIWAFLPQSTAAGIIKEAMIRLYYDRFEEAGQYLRLLVHDELFSECPTELLAGVQQVMKEEMERPIIQLALPTSYGMGESLVILTESKAGERWATMR